MRGATLLLSLAMVLAACSPAEETSAEEVTTTTGDEAPTTTAAATTTTAEATTTTEAATTTTAAAAGGGPDCLVGDWELDSEAFLEQLTAAMEQEAGGQDVTLEFVGGSYVLSLSQGGLYTGDRDEWGFQMVMADGIFRITIDGLDTGSWEADEQSLTVSDVESASILTAQAEIDGELVDLPQGTVPLVDTNAIGETASYTCSGDSLTVESPGGFTSQLTRVGG